MAIPEGDVLKPVGPSITNSDAWETFILSDAQVVYESNGKPANLLAAYADTPLKVTGRLEVMNRGQLKYCTFARRTHDSALMQAVWRRGLILMRL